MSYKINLRVLIFIVIVLIINSLFYYDASSSFNGTYSYKSVDLLGEQLNTDIADKKKNEKRNEYIQILQGLENKIESSDIKLFKNFVRFNIFVENNFEIKTASNESVAKKLGLDKDSKYIEVKSGQKEKLLSNLTLSDLSNVELNDFTFKPFLKISKEPDLKLYYDPDNEAIKFHIELSWISFFIFLIISVPVALGILLLLNAIKRFIIFGEPFTK